MNLNQELISEDECNKLQDQEQIENSNLTPHNIFILQPLKSTETDMVSLVKINQKSMNLNKSKKWKTEKFQTNMINFYCPHCKTNKCGCFEHQKANVSNPKQRKNLNKKKIIIEDKLNTEVNPLHPDSIKSQINSILEENIKKTYTDINNQILPVLNKLEGKGYELEGFKSPHERKSTNNFNKLSSKLKNSNSTSIDTLSRRDKTSIRKVKSIKSKITKIKIKVSTHRIKDKKTSVDISDSDQNTDNNKINKFMKGCISGWDNTEFENENILHNIF